MQRVNRVFWILVAVFVFATGLISKLIYNGMETHGLAEVDAWIDDVRPWFTAVRLTLLTAIIGGWPWWVGWLADYCPLDASRRQRALALRWRIAAWLACLDLLFAERLWQRFGEQLMAYLEG